MKSDLQLGYGRTPFSGLEKNGARLNKTSEASVKIVHINFHALKDKAVR